jgi:hypothetical protein
MRMRMRHVLIPAGAVSDDEAARQPFVDELVQQPVHRTEPDPG